jgi:tryptophan halogenase
MKKVVIVGGGTAGWLTALAAQQRYPNEDITVVESTEVGILGAGEGSVPDLLFFLNRLGIKVSDLIKETGATIKSGILFRNWASDGSQYFHSFKKNEELTVNKSLKLNEIDQTFSDMPVDELIAMLEYKRDSSKIDAMAIKKNNVPFVKKEEKNTKSFKDFDLYNRFSVHFDARLFAIFLSKVGISRGIKVVDAKVKNFVTDENNNIIKVDFDNSNSIECDFIFDCSGFYRLITGKHYNAEWISFSKHLPAKKAIPFFLDIDKESIEPYTDSVAMDYGWMWKIPLQHRYGCGYVFDSDFITEDQAKEEVEKLLGKKIISPKTFSFNPGHYEKIWNKNSIGIGLSSGFVEPLEATSIMQTVHTLATVFSPLKDIFKMEESHVKLVNDVYKKDCNEILNVIYLHYMTDKTNTDFWKNFTTNNEMPESLKKDIEKVKNYTHEENPNNFFKSRSYYTIIDGNNIMDRSSLTKLYDEKLKDYHDTIKKENELKIKESENFISHSDFIRYLGGLSEN